jgi:hypothetical protein
VPAASEGHHHANARGSLGRRLRARGGARARARACLPRARTTRARSTRPPLAGAPARRRSFRRRAKCAAFAPLRSRGSARPSLGRGRRARAAARCASSRAALSCARARGNQERSGAARKVRATRPQNAVRRRVCNFATTRALFAFSPAAAAARAPLRQFLPAFDLWRPRRDTYLHSVMPCTALAPSLCAQGAYVSQLCFQTAHHVKL